MGAKFKVLVLDEKTYDVEESKDGSWVFMLTEGKSFSYSSDAVNLHLQTGNWKVVKSSIQKPILEERKIGKVKMQLFDEGFPNAVMEIAKVMSWAEQNKGYKPNDFKNLPNANVEFSAAASRHKLKGLIQKDEGLPPLERVDEESGIVHLAHAAFNILAELELVLTGRIKE